MVYFERSQPAPECLAKEKVKKSGDYKCGDVLDRLKKDFKNKCYICEEKFPSGINVEHLLPHKSKNKELEFSWENLFLSCTHCNKSKGTKYSNILNCTKKDENPEHRLRHTCSLLSKEAVCIENLDNSSKTEETKELILKVYNGGGYKLKVSKLEAENIRKKLVKEVRNFYYVLEDYDDETLNSEDKEYLLYKIRIHLSTASAFTAFKRWIVRDSGFLEEFKQYLK